MTTDKSQQSPRRNYVSLLTSHLSPFTDHRSLFTFFQPVRSKPPLSPAAEGDPSSDSRGGFGERHALRELYRSVRGRSLHAGWDQTVFPPHRPAPVHFPLGNR